jgi:fumarate hydratase class II
MMPVIGAVLLDSISLLANSLEVLTNRYLEKMEPNREVCAGYVEKSLALATALTPWVGYERAAAIAKEAFHTGKTIREVCREKQLLPEEKLTKALDPWQMIRPK